MEFNLLIAGVGGQGILTIAQAISRVAMERGYYVKQSETHGMSQRGGAVQAHLRFADHPVYSDMIPLGQADMLLAVEPLEALRHIEYLSERGVVVCSNNPFENIEYPPLEGVLEQVAQTGEHVLIDAARLAKIAGSAKAENIVMLGAASLFMDLPFGEFERWIGEAFSAKGQRIVELNQRALQLGRRAATHFREALQAGHTSTETRKAMRDMDFDREPSHSTEAHPADFQLPSAAEEAIARIIRNVNAEGRAQLYEHEVYAIVEAAGAIRPPQHLFVPAGRPISADALSSLPGERVVLKIVSPQISHKTESGGLAFVPKTVEAVQREMRRLITEQGRGSRRIAGVLIVEYVSQADHALGSELFVGIRQTREFGPVIAAGLGGVDTEYLARTMRPGVAVAKAAVMDTSVQAFFELFQTTAAYEILSGQVRGHERQVSDADLICCFRAFIAIARRFCSEGIEGVCVDELEVNPFAFRGHRLVPLDGRGRLGSVLIASPPRPAAHVTKLLQPRSIAVVGVSGKRANFGRIILNNIQDCGFPADSLYVVKDDTEAIDGVQCVKDLRELSKPVDLVVAATNASRVEELVCEVLPGNGQPPACSSVILIPGAMGEKEGTEGVHHRLRASIDVARAVNGDAPVFLGGNCLGVRSRPGKYDTFFIPESKLDPRRSAPPKRVAIVSQSGGFLISRMSNLEFLDPMFCISIGNQVDLTVSDIVDSLAARDDLDCLGVYVEGFNDLDGLAFLRAVEKAVEAGKVVVFYKAGRTSAGRSAAQGHTASVAGDYDVCQAAVAAAGAIVTDTFKEFEQLLELATALHEKHVAGTRIGAISNAGYEAVGMADTVRGARYHVEMPTLRGDTRQHLQEVLETHRLDRLVDAKNPLDLTPMAPDAAYEDAIRVFTEADEIDALIVGCIPMTPTLLSTPQELNKPGSLAERLPRLFVEARKPMVFVVDCAGPYDELARVVRAAGVPVFRSADQAVRSVGRYVSYRNARRLEGDVDVEACLSQVAKLAAPVAVA